MKASIKCEDCNDALYFTPKQFSFMNFTICRLLCILGAFSRIVVVCCVF